MFNNVPDAAYLSEIGIKKFRSVAVKVSRNIYIRCRLAEAQNWRCCWCGTKCTEVPGYSHSATIEHLQPRSLGGPDHKIDEDPYNNYAMACASCNHRRGTISIEDFMAGRIPERTLSKQETKTIRRRAKQIDKYISKAKRRNRDGWYREDGSELCKHEWVKSLRIAQDDHRARLMTVLFGDSEVVDNH